MPFHRFFQFRIIQNIAFNESGFFKQILLQTAAQIVKNRDFVFFFEILFIAKNPNIIIMKE